MDNCGYERSLAVHKLRLAQDRLVYPQDINPGRTAASSPMTCGFNKNPQITTLLTTTKFINTKGGE